MEHKFEAPTPEDYSVINIAENKEISYWTKELGCNADELVEAIKAVGNSAEAVRQYLTR